MSRRIYIGRDGRWAVIVAIATGLSFLILNGMTRCTGVMYLSWKNEFQTSAALTGLLASIVSAVSRCIGPVAGAVCNRLGVRVTMVAGGILASATLFATFWVQTFVQMCVVFAIHGCGLGFVIMGGFVAISEYFEKYYETAHGFACTGFGVGMIAFPPLLRALLDEYGWRGALLVMSAITGNICVSGALYRPLYRPLPKHSEEDETVVPNPESPDVQERGTDSERGEKGGEKGRCATVVSLFGLDLFRGSYRFPLFCVINVLFSVPLVNYLVFVIPSATDAGISDETASFIISIFGIAGIIGRAASGLLVNWRVSALKLFAISLLFCGLATLLMQITGHFLMFVVTAIIIGCFGGELQAIYMVLLREIVGKIRLSSAIGILFFIIGVGELAGTFIAGGIYDITGSYPAVFYFSAGHFALALILTGFLPILERWES